MFARCWIAVIVIVLFCVYTSGLYFPQSKLTLKLPYSARQNEVKLIGLRTLRNDSATPQNVKYQIRIPREEPSVNLTNTNDVMLRNFPKNGALDIVIKATEKNFGEAMLEIKVQPIPTGKTINCADFVQDMCFWNTSRYKIYENQPVTIIGMFGPEAYSYVCPEFRVTRYELLNGTNYFHVVDGKLFANASLDRDIIGPPGGPGPHVKIQVRCFVWEEKTGMEYVQTEVLTIDVLDEDDNPPMIQGQTSINITLKDFFKGSRLVDENLLILTDADMVTSNQYNIRLLDDTFNVLNVTYDILPIDHPKLPRVPSTAILPIIYAKKTLLPISPYRVVLQVTDESLLAGYGVNSGSQPLSLSSSSDVSVQCAMKHAPECVEMKSDGGGLNALFDLLMSHQKNDVLSQYISKSENGRLFTLRSPGEKGYQLIRLNVYDVKDILNKDKGQWWKYAKVRSQFLTSSFVDPKQQLIQRLLDRAADDLMKVEGVRKEINDIAYHSG